jgi:N-acetyl-anhydromuramyl-L-alanine amidase AmpD
MSLHQWNASSVAICMIGGKGSPAFTPQQMTSLKELVLELQEEYPEARVIHHHELNPKIPDHGVDLISHTKEIIL